MGRIGIWGDSITWGSHDLEAGGWVARLRRFVDNDRDGDPAVYNLGISGDRVADVLRRFDAEYEARAPEAVVLAIGINDSPRTDYPGTPLDVFEQEYRDLAARARAKARTLLLVGPTNVDDEHPANAGYRNDAIDGYRRVVAGVARDLGVPLVDVFGAMTSDDLAFDGLHPVATGHETIFRAVRAALFP